MAVPLLGLVLARLVLLLMLTLDWQLEVLYAEVVLAGLCGGVTAVSGGTVTLLSLSCGKRERSVLLMRAEVTRGVAGMLGSVASGYLYHVTAGGLKPGVVTMSLCLLINAVCALYVLFFLEVSAIITHLLRYPATELHIFHIIGVHSYLSEQDPLPTSTRMSQIILGFLQRLLPLSALTFRSVLAP